MAESQGTTGPPSSVVLPQFPESPDAPIVAAINAKSRRLAAATELLLAATGSGDTATEPEPTRLLTTDRTTVTGSSMALNAAHRSTHVSATRAAELNHAELFARTAIRTALTARNNMRYQLSQNAYTTAGTLHKLNNATPDWSAKGPPMLDEIDAAARKVIQVTENTNDTMHRAAGLIKSILNEWPDSRDPAYTQQMQREQLTFLLEQMGENPAGSPDGMEAIPGMSPMKSFRDTLDKFGGFMIVHGHDDPQAPLNIASILPLLGPEQGGAKHFAVATLEAKDQGVLDALETGDSAPLSELLDRDKITDRDDAYSAAYNARIESVKTMLQNAANAGYQLHAVGVFPRGINYLPNGEPTFETWAQKSRDIVASRIPEGEQYIVYGDPRLTGVGSNQTMLDNVLQIPSYDVLHQERHSVTMHDGDVERQVPLVNPDEGFVWYNVFTAAPARFSPTEPRTEYIVNLNPVGS